MRLHKDNMTPTEALEDFQALFPPAVQSGADGAAYDLLQTMYRELGDSCQIDVRNQDVALGGMLAITFIVNIFMAAKESLARDEAEAWDGAVRHAGAIVANAPLLRTDLDEMPPLVTTEESGS